MSKTYLAVMQADSRMGASSSFKILKEKDIRSINLLGDFVTLYELVSAKAISKTKCRQLGLTFLGDNKRP